MYSLPGLLPVVSPGETVAELRVSKLMQAAGRIHTEVTPHVLAVPATMEMVSTLNESTDNEINGFLA